MRAVRQTKLDILITLLVPPQGRNNYMMMHVLAIFDVEVDIIGSVEPWSRGPPRGGRCGGRRGPCPRGSDVVGPQLSVSSVSEPFVSRIPPSEISISPVRRGPLCPGPGGLSRYVRMPPPVRPTNAFRPPGPSSMTSLSFRRASTRNDASKTTSSTTIRALSIVDGLSSICARSAYIGE